MPLEDPFLVRCCPWSDTGIAESKSTAGCGAGRHAPSQDRKTNSGGKDAARSAVATLSPESASRAAIPSGGNVGLAAGKCRRYRAHGHTLYRDPAYLLVSDPNAPITEALQAYFYRWEIEVDQKEEKDLLGVGQAQVWNDTSVERQPAFHVATYAALLVAAIKAYGLKTTSAAG
jgi:hypothetical protein